MGTSTGLLLIFRLGDDLSLELLRVIPAFGENGEGDVLVTSLAWNPSSSLLLSSGAGKGREIAVTGSDGRVAVVIVDLVGSESRVRGGDEVVWVDKIHDEAAWIVEWLPPDPTQPSSLLKLITGGDDAAIHITQPTKSTPAPKLQSQANEVAEEVVEEEELEESALHPIDLIHQTTARKSNTNIILSDFKIHTAGVTAILLLGQDILVTGSYDQFLRILSIPVLGQAPPRRKWQVLADKDLEGGVWRVQVLDSFSATSLTKSGDGDGVRERGRKRWLLLVACMHAGVAIVEVSHSYSRSPTSGHELDPRDHEMGDEKWSIEILARFEEHASMCYAVCAKQLSVRKSGNKVWRTVSTSFYDRLVCVWDFEWHVTV